MQSILHAFTHSVVWASVIASVFFAAFVTLLIEYFAKPGLEARKERILENRREQRTAIKNAKRAAYLADRLRHTDHQVKGDYINARWKDFLRGEEKDLMAEIEELAENGFVTLYLGSAFNDTFSEALYSLSQFPKLYRANIDIDNEHWEQITFFAKMVDDFATLLTTSKWHPMRRQRLVRKISSSYLPGDPRSKGERKR
jgi:hypothetical protein